MSHMRYPLRKLLPWIIPQPYLKGLKQLLYGRSLAPKYEALIAANKSLHNRHANRKRCFVIGNGPSLKTQDITRLKDEICIVANSFFFHPDLRTVVPLYWCVADPDYPTEKPNALAWLRELETHSAAATMFFNPSAATVIEKYALFRDRKVHYIDAGLSCNSSDEVNLDLSSRVNVGACTVSLFSIPLAIYLGFCEVYLIGCDANWLAVGDNVPLHFYETNPYFKHWDTTAATNHAMGLTMEDELRCQYGAFKSHRLIRDKALSMGVRIFNASHGGCLDMYPRVAYETLFSPAVGVSELSAKTGAP